MKFYPKFYIVLGSVGNSSIYVKDSDGDWREFINYEYFKVIKKQNQVSEFEVKIMDLEAAEKLYVKEFAEVLFLSENNLILKGRIQKIKYETAYEAFIHGFGMEAKLLEKELIKSGDKRVQYTNESAQTVANEILSSGTDGSAPWIITPNTTGLFDTDYGNISIRYEYGNRLNSIAKLTEAIDYEWSVSQGGDYSDDLFDLAPLLPNSTRATVSQETFEITGANANCSQTEKEKDITNLANKIDALGYGDGVNQKHTSTYNASATYSTLSADITTSSTTISLIDASSFDSSGTIRIMEEQITYAGKSGNDLTGCTRGVSGTTALAHKKNVYTEKYIAISSAEAGSSIGTNGLMDYTVTERDIIDVETLELIASRKLLERMDPIVRIKVIPNEPLETAGNRKIGDLITITDAESDISDDYRIVGMTYISDYGFMGLEIEASNKSLTFIEQMQKQREASENLSKYMQGATNIYSIQSYENCDVSHPLNMRFYVPSEAVAINKVLLSFKMKDFRGYTTTSDVNDASTVIASSDAVGESVSITSNVWTNGVGITTANSDCEGVFLTFETDLIQATGTLPETNGNFYYRIYDGTNYYPTSSGSRIMGGDLVFSGTTLSGAVAQYVPGNQKNKTFTLQLKWAGYHANTNWLVNTYASYTTISRHTHDMGYAISEETLASPSVVVIAGAESSEASVGTYTTDQTDIDITTNVTDVGAGNWINVKFTPNKNMRIEGNCHVQIFIESKV